MPDTDFANVAQLVEQRFRKPQVVGSIPTVGSSFWVFEVEQRRPESVRGHRLQFFHDVAAEQVRGGSFWSC